MIRRGGRGAHKTSSEKNPPFEVVFLLETSLGVTRLVKQTIKHNGRGGLHSFISEGKNKVRDDPGGFWRWIGREFPYLLEQFTLKHFDL